MPARIYAWPELENPCWHYRKGSGRLVVSCACAGDRCLERVEHLRGEFHCNRLLLERGYSIEGLLDHCARFIPAANILVDRLEMGE